MVGKSYWPAAGACWEPGAPAPPLGCWLGVAEGSIGVCGWLGVAEGSIGVCGWLGVCWLGVCWLGVCWLGVCWLGTCWSGISWAGTSESEGVCGVTGVPGCAGSTPEGVCCWGSMPCWFSGTTSFVGEPPPPPANLPRVVDLEGVPLASATSEQLPHKAHERLLPMPNSTPVTAPMAITNATTAGTTDPTSIERRLGSGR